MFLAGLGNSNSPGYAAFSEGLVTDLSARLGVNTSQISVKAVSLPGTASRRLLSSEVRLIPALFKIKSKQFQDFHLKQFAMHGF